MILANFSPILQILLTILALAKTNANTIQIFKLEKNQSHMEISGDIIAINEIFQLFDVDFDFYLSSEEFFKFLESSLRFSTYRNEWLKKAACVDDFFDHLDLDLNGQLDMDEFAPAAEIGYAKDEPVEFLRILFEAADESANGLVNNDEFIDANAQQWHMSYQMRDESAKDPKNMEWFKLIDTNHDGQIDWKEFLHIYQTNSTSTTESVTPTEETTTSQPSSTTAADSDDGTSPDARQANFDRFDADADGQLDFDEFLDFYANEHSLSPNQKERVSYQPVFRVFFQDLIDVDGNGQISFEEAIAHHSREKEFSILDINANGFLDFDEFVEFFEGMSGYSGPQMHVYMPYLRLEFVKLDGDGDGRLSFEECLAQQEVFDLTKMPS